MLEQEALTSLERDPLERVHPSASRAGWYPPGYERGLSLQERWHILLKHKWTILTAAFIATVSVTLVCFKMRPVYSATARVEVEAESPTIQTVNDLYRGVPSDTAFLQTQLSVLGSDSLAWQTIEQLQLGKTMEFTPSRWSEVDDSPISFRNWILKKFRKRLNVKLVRGSRILEVSFKSTDPAVAARVANALVNSYIEYNFHKTYDATRQVSAWMTQQLDELKAKVEKSQQAVVDYERQNAIANINEKQNVVEKRLEDLSKDFTAAQNERMQRESLYNLVNRNESQVAFVAQNEVLQRLEEKYADLKSQYVEALDQYGPNFPKVLRLLDQVGEVQSLVDGERKRAVARIRHDYDAAVGREKLLLAAVAAEKVEVGRLNQLLIQHNILAREFETNQHLYNTLLERLKDATVSAGLKANNIHVVDAALEPSIPIMPKKLLNIVMALLGGLLMGAGLAFVQESLDQSVKNSQDVERLIDRPCLAIIPADASDLHEGPPGLKAESDKKSGCLALVVLTEPASVVAESYRALRTSILLSTAYRPPQVLLVTSSQPNEGKTSVSLNLALTLAQRGSRVLVVDGDLRKPAIAERLGVSNEKGLSSVLAGAHPSGEALQSIQTLPGLWVLPAGPNPPNPAELLSSSRMQELLQELRQRFDYLIVDSPPSLMLTDATILSALAEGVLLVAESGVTPRAALLRTDKILSSAGGRILGVVLNKADLRSEGHYYGCSYRGINEVGRLSVSNTAALESILSGDDSRVV